MTEQITLHTTPEKYEKCFPNGCLSPPVALRSSEPGDIVQAVYMMDGHYFANEAEWGYIPPKRTFVGKPIYYAAGDGITHKGTVASAFRNWRCVVPASNFTYLREVKGRMRRFKVYRRDRGLMLLAGIMEPNPPHLGGSEATVALITTTPNWLLARHGLRLHAPLVLEQKQVEPWLRPRTSIADVKSFIQSPADFALKVNVYLDPVAKPALA